VGSAAAAITAAGPLRAAIARAVREVNIYVCSVCSRRRDQTRTSANPQPASPAVPSPQAAAYSAESRAAQAQGQGGGGEEREGKERTEGVYALAPPAGSSSQNMLELMRWNCSASAAEFGSQVALPRFLNCISGPFSLLCAITPHTGPLRLRRWICRAFALSRCLSGVLCLVWRLSGGSGE
jgi:hypothetical protein